MAATATTTRLNYGVNKKAPKLPITYQLSPWSEDPSAPTPKQLDIAEHGCYLDGLPIPGGRQFIDTWIKDKPNQSGDSGDEELALSYYSPSNAVGQFLWATFEFEEDRSAVIGIACANVHGQKQLCYVTGTPMAKATPPNTKIPATKNETPEPEEMFTLTFPSLTKVTGDTMTEDLSWVMDEHWRAPLVTKKRPDISAKIPAPLAAERLAFLDANAEWFNAVYGPATLGLHFDQTSKVTHKLSAVQLATLGNFVRGPMGNMQQNQQDHAMAARVAHYKQNPRLLNYAGSGRAFLDLLQQSNGPVPSAVTFLAETAGNTETKACAMRLINRYACVLTALDGTHALELELRKDVICASLLHPPNDLNFDQAEMEKAFADTLVLVHKNSATPLFGAAQTLFNNELSNAQNAVALGHQLAAFIFRELTRYKEGTLNSGRAQSGIGKWVDISNTASAAYDEKFPTQKVGISVFYGLCMAYSTYVYVCMYMNWAHMSDEERANLIGNTFVQVCQAADLIKTACETAKLAGKVPQQLDKAIGNVIGSVGVRKMLGIILERVDPKVYLKAVFWMSDTAEKAGETAEKAVAKVAEIAKAIGQGAEAVGKLISCLGPLTAAVSLAISFATLIEDIASGSGIAQIVLDGLNMVVDAAMVVMAIVDIAIEAAAVTVIGIIFVAIALALTAVIAIVSLLLQLIQPESPQDEYMQHVVRPFLAMLPQAVPPPAEKKLAKHATKLNVSWRGQAFEHQAATA